jgi:hypothetical protein
MRRIFVMLVSCVLAACGGSTARPSSEATAATSNDPPPRAVLVLGVRLDASQFSVLPDGEVVTSGGDHLGRIERDGTLRRADDTVLARLGSDGTFTLDDPSRVHDAGFAGMRIDGGRLLGLSTDTEPTVIVEVHGGQLVDHRTTVPIAGLTAANERTFLALYADVLLQLAEGNGGYF